MVVMKDRDGKNKTTLTDIGYASMMIGATGYLLACLGVGGGLYERTDVVPMSIINYSAMASGLGVVLVGTDLKSLPPSLQSDDTDLLANGMIVAGLPFIYIPIIDMVLPRNTNTDRIMAASGILMPVGTLMISVALARKITNLYD